MMGLGSATRKVARERTRKTRVRCLVDHRSRAAGRKCVANDNDERRAAGEYEGQERTKFPAISNKVFSVPFRFQTVSSDSFSGK